MLCNMDLSFVIFTVAILVGFLAVYNFQLQNTDLTNSLDHLLLRRDF